jgi:hypothetical protein
MTTQFSREDVKDILDRVQLARRNGVNGITYDEAEAICCMLLAGMDSEPVAFIVKSPLGHVAYRTISADDAEYIKRKGYTCEPLYAAPPAPVAAPDEMEPTIEAIKSILPTSNPDEYAACIGADMWNACRAAMLAPGVMYDPRTATTGSATMQSFGNPEQLKVEPVSQRYTLPPHIYRELVNQLRDTAVKYKGCQQLREQISETLSMVITPAAREKEV